VSHIDGHPLAPEIDFGSILIGETSHTEKILVRNQGQAALTGLSFSISGADPGNFSFSSGLPHSLVPGECAELELQFTPSDKTTHFGSLEISSNDPNQSLVEVSMKGHGRFPLRLPGSDYLKASNIGIEDGFGHSVAASDDTLVIGAPYEASGDATDGSNNSINGSGAVYIFHRQDDGSWLEKAYLKASNLEVRPISSSFFDHFGSSVAVSGNFVAVGALGEGDNNSSGDSGAAYVFRRQESGTWLEESYLKASNFDNSPRGNRGGRFGESVAISGNTMVIGASMESSGSAEDRSDNSTGRSGAAYVFRLLNNGTWIEELYLKASNIGENDQFGKALAISGNTVVIGAAGESSGNPIFGNDDSAKNSGAAYSFLTSSEEPQLARYFETLTREAPELIAANHIPGANPFNDGVTNLLKYAFNMNLRRSDVTPMTPGGMSGLPLVFFTEKEGERFLQFEFVRLRENGPRYIPEISPSLHPDSFTPVEGHSTVESIDSKWERVQMAVPVGPLACWTS
jgi:hypothetical protein